MRLIGLSAFLLLSCSLASTSNAEVNPINGAFYYVLPLAADSTGTLPPILLSYDHQNQSRGLFGQGWCSEFDARLVVESAIHASFQICRGVQAMNFEKLNDQYMTLARSKPSAYPRIHLSGGNYVVERTPVDRMTFDKNGQLVAIEKLGRVLTIQRTNEALIGGDRRKKAVLKLQFSSESRVTALMYQGRQIQFSYKSNLLGSIVDRRLGKTWNFQYDPEGRVISVVEPSQKAISVRYAKQLNLVEQIADKNCSTDLKYKFINAAEFGLDTSARCGGKTERRTYSFKVSEKSIATEVRNEKGQVVTGELEDKITGKVSKSLKPDGTIYLFNEENLLDQKLSRLKKVRYSYDARGILNEIEIADGTGYRRAGFHYDRLNQISGVDLGGREIQVSEGTAGLELNLQAAKIKFQNGRPVTYLNGKPLRGLHEKLSFSQTREILNLGEALEILKERENAYIF